MKEKTLRQVHYFDGIGRRFHTSEDRDDRHRGPHSLENGRGRRDHRGGRHGGRLFDYGDLRLLLLAMIADKPRHGYEIIKAIEERFGGSYTPSPGVIYPTLSWLVDMGYATAEAEDSGRKSYRITTEGEAFLTANRTAADELLARAGSQGGTGRDGVPAAQAVERS
jgi:DNA-binding PadR family transcriptional regulator